ncbi:cytochrome P450 [Candidatus Poriferisodalis sp.]|uniref:cytochrome P450 n=1 Tax=Candidatus Poriferisodalis sp. TaxID=3101277 RepID=UPI003B026751
MSSPTVGSAAPAVIPTLSLPEELILMLLNEETGYFHQVPGWHLNCAMAGAALAELSLQARIDTDMEHLILLDKTPTGDPVLDFALHHLTADGEPKDAQYWVERLAPYAEIIIDLALDRLTNAGMLEYHDGNFWTLTTAVRHGDYIVDGDHDTAVEFIKTRIGKSIFGAKIPSPRDVIIIGLASTCEVLRFIFEIDDDAEDRIQLLRQMDLIGQAIANAVAHNLAGPSLRHAAFTKQIPAVPLRRLIFNRHALRGNLPAYFAELQQHLGPIYHIKPPLKMFPDMYVLAGPKTNRWVHRYGRMYLRSRDYFRGIEAAYHASGLLPALDGAEHFRMRKALRSSYSRANLERQMSKVYADAKAHIAAWSEGDTFKLVEMCHHYSNAQLSPLLVSVDSQDVVDDIIAYKQRALSTHVARVLPRFLLRTPGMKRKAKSIDLVVDRIQRSHTSGQRTGCPRDHADDLLALHNSDPIFLPESNLKFALSAPVLAAMYVGDELSFILHALMTHPDLYRRVQAEADAVFGNPEPRWDLLDSDEVDVTQRFFKECLRLYPTIPGSIRTVMNSCVVEDYALPIGARVFVATTASHYLDDVFPDPYTFDIDRYLPERGEHRSPGYAPFGLGTHNCLGQRLVELQLVSSVLLLAHCFTFELKKPERKLSISPFPSLSPAKRIKVVIKERRHKLAI